MRRPLPLFLLLAATAILGLLAFGSDTASLPPEAALSVPADAVEVTPTATPTSFVAAPGDPAPTTSTPHTGWTITGRVLGAGRHPVAGARVTACVRARDVGVATTAADGTYVLDLTPRDLGGQDAVLLTARAEGPRGATAGIRLHADGGPTTAPPLILEHATDFVVRLTAEGRAVPGAAVVIARRAAGRMHVAVRGETDAAGRLTCRTCAVGVIHVFAAAAGRGRAHGTARIGAGEGAMLTLAMPAARTLRVRVRDQATKSPLANARVRVGTADAMPRPMGPGGLPTPLMGRTGPTGEVTFYGLGGREQLFVRAGAVGHASRVGAPALGGAGEEAELTLDLERARRVAFEIVPGGVPAPVRGRPLRVVLAQGHATSELRARVDGNDVVVEGLPQDAVRGTVVGPDGAYAAFAAEQDETRGVPVTFEAPRRVRVRVRGADGEAVPGVALRLDPLGHGVPPVPARTDAGGVATFERVSSDRAGVQLAEGRVGAGTTLRRLDLELPEDPYDVTLSPLFAVEIATSIDGEARLPTRYTLRIDGQAIPPAGIEEHAAEGVLHAQTRRSSAAMPAQIRLEAVGFEPVTQDVPEGDVAVSIDLVRTGVITARVEPPPDGHMRLALRRWDEASDTWRNVERSAALSTPRRAGAEGRGRRFRLGGLAPGRYRLEDRATQVHSDPVRLDARTRAAAVALDLRKAVWVRGRVSAPAGTDLTKARVLQEDRAPEVEPYEGARVRSDGTFRVRALRGRHLVLSVVHPARESDPALGQARVTAGGRVAELALR